MKEKQEMGSCAPVIEADRGRPQEAPTFPTSLQLGLWAPTLTEQGFAPFLPNIEHYERDDAAISRLHIGHLITHTQHIAARGRLAKKIKQALAARGRQRKR